MFRFRKIHNFYFKMDPIHSYSEEDPNWGNKEHDREFIALYSTICLLKCETYITQWYNAIIKETSPYTNISTKYNHMELRAECT